tara:strand:+ start:332 stop:931 length:600 start_codon:yes stop_codon:yes gene_type:complete
MAHLDAKKAAIAGDWDKAWEEAQRDSGFQDAVPRVYWTRWMIKLLASEGFVEHRELKPLFIRPLNNQLKDVFLKPVSEIRQLSEGNTACMAAAYADLSLETPLIVTAPDYYIVGQSELVRSQDADYFAILIYDNDKKTHVALHIRIDGLTNERSVLSMDKLHFELANAATSIQALYESYRFTWLKDIDGHSTPTSAKIA